MSETEHPLRRITDHPEVQAIVDRRVRRSNNFFVFASMVMLVMVAMILTVVYWETYPYKTLSFPNGNLDVRPQELALSSTEVNVVHLSGQYCKEVEGKPTSVKRVLVGEFTSPLLPFKLDDVKLIEGTGCTVLDEDVTIPKVLNTGRYYLHTEYTFHLNPLKEKTATIDSGVFLIVPGPKQEVIPQ